MFRIDNSENDAPYQGIHIYRDDQKVFTFWEDDAPVRDFNHEQRIHAQNLVNILNQNPELYPALLRAQPISKG